MSDPTTYPESGEDLIGIDDDLPDAHLFRVEAIPSELT